jgi:L-amino acid N-acyltransferase YncA
MLRENLPSDLAGICEIYNHYVEHTCVTFDEDPLSRKEMQAKVEQVTADYPWNFTTQCRQHPASPEAGVSGGRALDPGGL